MTEEEIKEKLADLEAKEGALNEKEAELSKREADASAIGETIKAEYEKRLSNLKEDYEKRLKARDDVIKQLAGGNNEEPLPSPFDEMNKRRRAQKAA